MTDVDSPFTLDRFEHERTHLYFLPEKVFNLLEEKKPTYIIGSRGTGKTTLLHSLNWKERLENESLKGLISDPFGKNFIGLYMRVPHFKVDSFEEWLKDEADDLQGVFFSLYIDLIWIELACEAVADLVIDGFFKASPSDEYKLTKAIFQIIPELSGVHENYNNITLRVFKRTINKLRKNIEKYAILRVPLKDVIDFVPIGQVGEVGRVVSSELAKFCDQFSDKIGWHFKICMDETECLSAFQQKVINTIIRLSENNIIFIVSYVRKIDDLNNTIFKRISLQKADRQLINLDVMSDKEFKDLAEGVARVRIEKLLNVNKVDFNITKILGKLNINLLLNHILEESESSTAKKLQEKSIVNRSNPFFSGETSQPVIYQTYLIDKLRIKLPSPSDAKWKRRKQSSAEIRKRMVASYLCLCKELNTEVYYAFDQMVLQMSDKCIRDFLSQIHEIYIESGLSIDGFINKYSISFVKQNQAIKRASLQKKDSLPSSGVTAPYEVNRIVDALSQITATIQNSNDGNKALRTHERGKFNVDTRGTSDKLKETLKLIKEAGEAGFLKIENEGTTWEFRVHCSLAAAYGFSYRGAYNPTSLSLADLYELSKKVDEEERKRLILKISKKLSGEEQQSSITQLSLF